MRRSEYSEGEWFVVPLRHGGFALGVIARASKRGILFGYFFGPRRQEPPSLEDADGLRPGQAILITRFGHLGLRDGNWPRLGRRTDWAREVWALPPLVRYEELTGRTFHVQYDATDPSIKLDETQVPPGTAEHGPNDGLAGAGWVELRLTNLLA